MNPGITSERVYAALKRRLLAGDIRPGERLDPAVLSEMLSSSVTPVRDVLHILIGERLLETRTGEGFFRPHLTAPDLEDLYAWSHQLLTVALRHRNPARALRKTQYEALADRAGDLFLQIGAMSANAEHGRAVAGVNDRLHAVRTVEDRALPDVAAELDDLECALGRGNDREIAKQLSAYHRRRARVASDIVRAVYRPAEQATPC